MSLFEVDPVEPEPKLSYGRRLTIRRQAALDAGRHPVTGLFLQPVGLGHHCGGCSHLRVIRYAGTYHKCDLNDTHSQATDVRKTWPACARYEEATE